MPKNKQVCYFRNKGFTLIELLITISIIAILAAIGLMAYSAVLKQGRDSKRQSDIRSIQSALEQYFADQFYYPSGLTFGSPLSFGSKTYMNTIPTDPQSSPNYCYLAIPNNPCDNSSANKCTSYKLYAKLENQPNGSYSCGSVSTYNLEVTPP